MFSKKVFSVSELHSQINNAAAVYVIPLAGKPYRLDVLRITEGTRTGIH
jgi:hypothetical protein